MKTSILATVKKIKEHSEDYEFYPTSDFMLKVVRADILKLMPNNDRDDDKYPYPKILDIGAGNGSSLQYLTNEDNRYAIEKSKILIDLMDKDSVLIGTDFHVCTLIDKPMDVIFCNPPYSEFAHWMEKIIKEANAKLIYFVVPTRWKDSPAIEQALKLRKAKITTLESTDFLDAERKARAKVDILRLDLASLENKDHWKSFDTSLNTDPFDIWFDEEFPFKKVTDIFEDVPESETLTEKVENKLVAGRGLINVLVELYDLEMNHLFKTYKAIASLDPTVLREIKIDVNHIKRFIKEKINGLKHKFWHEFFENYDSITNNLTSDSRKKLLHKLHNNVHVDFSATNAYAVTVWVLKNANTYFDSQLLAMYSEMIDNCNVIKYVSNQKIFKDEKHVRGYYGRHERIRNIGKVALDYRIIISKGGLDSGYGSSRYNGLSPVAYDFINDLIIIGKNLGYRLNDWDNAGTCEYWHSNEKRDFKAVNDNAGLDSYGCAEIVEFMSVRAFMNGNLHIKFNPNFMRHLNVMHGKLKGWVKDWQDVEREFDFKGKDKKQAVTREQGAEILSRGNFQLLPENTKDLLTKQKPVYLKRNEPSKINLPAPKMPKKITPINPTPKTSKKDIATPTKQMDLLSLKEKYVQQLKTAD